MVLDSDFDLEKIVVDGVVRSVVEVVGEVAIFNFLV